MEDDLLDDSSDLEDSWAAEDALFDGSPLGPNNSELEIAFVNFQNFQNQCIFRRLQRFFRLRGLLSPNVIWQQQH